MLFQAERMSITAHMMLAFPWVIEMGMICCEILDIHLQQSQYLTTAIFFSPNQQFKILFRKYISFILYDMGHDNRPHGCVCYALFCLQPVPQDELVAKICNIDTAPTFSYRVSDTRKEKSRGQFYF